MSNSAFMTAMCDEVRRQGGENIYYSVVTMEKPGEGEGLYHMEKVDFQPGNPGHDCYSTAKAITSIAVGILHDRGLLKLDDPLGKYPGARKRRSSGCVPLPAMTVISR